jgi:hypothetical protein
MPLGQIATRLDELHGSQTQTFLFQALDYRPDQAPLHTIRFQQNQCLLHKNWHPSITKFLNR